MSNSGFFHKVSVDNLTMNNYFVECAKHIASKFENMTIQYFVIVSPDEGGVKRASKLANLLKCQMALLHKKRSNPNEIGKMLLMGNVSGQCCIIVDDMIDTAGTAMKACQVLREIGADNICVIACHGILSGPAIKRIIDCIECDSVYVSNSNDVVSIIENNQSKVDNIINEKIKIFDISELCASAI
jgi:ribose-phosphate pyrophosphokinase